MSKTPKFLICENPMVDSGLFILHTRTPLLLAQVLHFDTEEERMEAQKLVEVGSHTTLDEDEHVLLNAMWMIPSEKLTAMTAQERADSLAKLMSRMADWYHAYCKWEDGQHESTLG